MSRARPSHRDLLERELLRVAKERLEANERYDRTLKDLQARLEAAENGAPMERVVRGAHREDAIDRVNQGLLKPAIHVVEELRLPEDESSAVGEELAAAEDQECWRKRCTRLTAFIVGLLREIKDPSNKQPKLVAHEGLFALGVDSESMRTVAKMYGLTTERISQRAEQTRERFNLPKNQHNKSESAVGSYRATAHLTKGQAA